MLRKILCLLPMLFLFAGTAQAKPLVVYSNMEPDMVSKYTKAFNEKHPDVELKWVRDSAGPITARLLAEKDAPQADIAFGLSLNSVLMLKDQGLFQPYAPTGFDSVAENMRDDDSEPVWVAITAWAMDLCINKPELEKKGLPVPKTWNDLLDPAYKGHIVMPSPVTSSTGYMAMAGWFTSMGEASGWKYMDSLNENIRMYTHSGCKPAQMAAQGETVIGMSSFVCAVPYVNHKAPILTLEPEDGLGWDMEAVAILKGAKNLDDAKKLMDFAASPDVVKIVVGSDYIPNRPDLATPEIKKTYDLLLPVDFKQDAAKRESRLQEWRERFEGGEGKAQ